MKSIFLLLVLITGLFHMSNSAQKITESEWLGSLQTAEGDRSCRLKTRDDVTTFTIYQHIAKHWGVKDMIQDGRQIQFSCQDGPSSMDFVGVLNVDGDKLIGTIKHQTLTYEIELNKRQTLAPENYTPFLGSYRTKEGLVFYVTENQQTLHLHSPVSGEYVVLKLIGDNYFHTRTGEEYLFSNHVNGKMQNINWSDKHGNKISALRFNPYEIEELVFYTRQDTIYGSLYLPKNQASNPAMMLALGAGRFDRHAYSLEAELMASEGIASLIVDFPGTGKSSGSIHDNTFDHKRDMTIDIFRSLQKHPLIDGSRCGIRGGSQSGRVALMAAAKIPDIAAVISVNVPISSQLETQLFAIGQFLRSSGFDDATNTKTCRLWQQYFEQIIDGKIDSSLMREITNFRNLHEGIYLPNSTTTNLPRSPHAEDLAHNTASSLLEIACPVLFQLSILDERVSFTSTLNAITNAVNAQPDLDFDIVEYPFANHSLMLPGYQITQGLFLDKINWLKEHLANK